MHKPYLLLSLVLLLFACCEKSSAQANTDTLTHQRAQTIFAEIGSAGILFSANYDTRFTKNRNGWGGRIGFSYFSDVGDQYYMCPIQVNYLFGRTKNFFELGTGITFGTIHSDEAFFNGHNHDISGTIGTITAGFRHQALGRGIFYKISVDGLYNPQDLHDWFAFAGIGLGYTFR